MTELELQLCCNKVVCSRLQII